MQTAKNAIKNDRYAAVFLRASINLSEREYIEKDGFRIRVWGHCDHDFVKDEDVRSWLLNLRVVEDLRSGLEYVRQSYIDNMVRNDFLRWDSNAKLYWITAKCAERFKLPKVMNCKFPK